MTPETPEQAVTLALWLALTADTEERIDRAIAIAEEIATSLTAAQVKTCKAAAIRWLKTGVEP